MSRRDPKLAVIEQLPGLDFRIWHATPTQMPHAHAHPDIEINLLLSGSISYFMSGRFHDVRAGEIAIFWGGMPHQSLTKSRDLSGIWMTIPLSWLMRWKHATALLRLLLEGELITHATSSAAVDSFQKWSAEFNEGDLVMRDVIIQEVEAYLSRISIGLKEKQRSRRRRLSPMAQRVERITVYLGAQYRSDISVEKVAKSVGLHPKYMLSLFRQTCGMTLWEYVIRLRLAHAQRLLLTTDRTVLDIALEAGFGSASAFYRAFRKYESRSPAQFRAS